MSSEIENEPIPGLPELLPPGESIVWQGRPEWKTLARDTFQLRWLALYFAIFVTIRAVVAGREGQGMPGALEVGLGVARGATCIGILALMAWLNARATVYTITTRRIVMRIGVALPTTFNLPFKRLGSADLKKIKNGGAIGDIVLELSGSDRIAWLHLWPHVQPWHFSRSRPTLRAIPEARRVADLLGDAVQAWAASSSESVRVASVAAGTPITVRAAVPMTSDLATEGGR